jgi:hypothetical protein
LIVLLWVICRHFLSQCVWACERPWRCPLCWSSEWRLFWRGQFCTLGSLELLSSYSPQNKGASSHSNNLNITGFSWFLIESFWTRALKDHQISL